MNDALLDLDEARLAYRAAMRRYGEHPCAETKLEWMRAGRQLAAAVTGRLGVA